MASISASLLTAAFTAFFGVGVLVTGQILQKFFIDPIQAQRKTIGKIAFALIYYGNSRKLSIPDYQEEPHRGRLHHEVFDIMHKLRSLGSDLRASLYTIPCYGLFSRIEMVPDKPSILKESGHLVG